MSIQHTHQPIADRVQARAIADFLRAPETGDSIRVATADGSFMSIPAEIAAALAHTAEAFAHGNGVIVREAPHWIDRGHAAEFLGVRRRRVVQLIAERAFPSVERDGVPVVALGDLIEYQAKEQERRADAAQGLLVAGEPCHEPSDR